MNGQRFQNYEAYFTVLNTRESIDKEWLNMLIYDHDNSLKVSALSKGGFSMHTNPVIMIARC